MAKLLAIGLAVACVCSTLASAQDKSSDQPAKYVWYSVEKVNSGKFALYMKTAVQFREAVSSAAPEVTWIAGSPITGDSDQITYVTFHDNLASIERMMKAMDKVGDALMKNAARIIQRAFIAILQLLTIRILSGAYYRGNILHATEILLDSDRAKNRGGFHDATGLDDRNCRDSAWTSRCSLAQWATSRAGSHFV